MKKFVNFVNLKLEREDLKVILKSAKKIDKLVICKWNCFYYRLNNDLINFSDRPGSISVNFYI